MFKKIDSIIIINFHNYWKNPLINKYLVNASDRFEGILIIKKNNKKNFLSHPFNYEQVRKEFKKNIIVKKLEKDSLKKILAKDKTIGYDSRYTTIKQLNNLRKILVKKKFVDCSKQNDKNREIKNSIEIKNISIAVKETKRIIKTLKEKLVKGITEKELELFVRKEFEENGFETAFCIIAFGKNTTNLHHVPTNTKLSDGPVLFDLGAKYNGYCADISESFWFGEKNKIFLEYEREHKKITDYFERIKKVLKPNVNANKIFFELKDDKLAHSIGHGIGLEEHDLPAGISPKSNWLLKEGMVLAIEPGKYNKKFGIRIEKDFLIKKDGFKEL